MAAYYLDTSALVKRYAMEPGTNWIEDLTDPKSGHDIYTVILTGAEMIAALFRKARTLDIAQPEAIRAAHNFRPDWQTHYQIIEIIPSTVERAMDLIERHGLRGYDAVHIASALAIHAARATAGLGTLTFISSDMGQLGAAALEGLVVDNPASHA